MTESIDHRGLALHLAESASENEQAGRPDTALFEVHLAQVHATLALSDPPPVQYAVREVLEDERVAGLQSRVRDLESDLRIWRRAVKDFVVAEHLGTGGAYVTALRRLRDLNAAPMYAEQEDES